MKHIVAARKRRQAQEQTLQDMRRIRAALEAMRPGILQDMQRTVLEIDASRGFMARLQGLIGQS